MPAKSRPKNNRCRFTSSDGRRCRLIRAEGHASLCLKHWRLDQGTSDRETQSPEAAAVLAEVLGSGAKLNTETAVNDALSKLFMLRARKQVSARDTALFAYIIQLLLQTLNGAHNEFTRIHDYAAWNQIVEKAIQDASSTGDEFGAEDDAPEPKPKAKRRRKVARTRREFAEQVSADLASVPDDSDESADQSPDESAGEEQVAHEGGAQEG
jgi:hypothetical protein